MPCNEVNHMDLNTEVNIKTNDYHITQQHNLALVTGPFHMINIICVNRFVEDETK